MKTQTDKGSLRLDRLRDWMEHAEELDDCHVDAFVEVPAWNDSRGPGPVNILPNIVHWSLVVFNAALSLVGDYEGRDIDLYIELKWGRNPIRHVPESRGQVNRMLSLTPPSLTVYNTGQTVQERAPSPIKKCVRISPERILAGEIEVSAVRSDFVEFQREPHSFPRYVIFQSAQSPPLLEIV
jgi:hypothetical protein